MTNTKPLTRLETLQREQIKRAREKNARLQAKVDAEALRILAATQPDLYGELIDKATDAVEKTAKAKATRVVNASRAANDSSPYTVGDGGF